jgi:hypothetical protein
MFEFIIEPEYKQWLIIFLAHGVLWNYINGNMVYQETARNNSEINVIANGAQLVTAVGGEVNMVTQLYFYKEFKLTPIIIHISSPCITRI